MLLHRYERCSTKNCEKFSVLFLSIILMFCVVSNSAWALVTVDGSLGKSGSIASVNKNYSITPDWGKQVGPNLFHSFGTFNIETNYSATFTGPNSISNIISRVTGGTPSSIDGLLRSSITGANLYLINPAGVMFGPNASLDVSGSFHVSTADYLKLGQDGFFYATTPEKSVLTSSPPSAFGFLSSKPGSISFDTTSLEVPSGQTISVIGGDILMYNSTLRAQGGRINLASAASAGEVIPTSTDLVMQGFTKQGNITVLRDTPFTYYYDIDIGAYNYGQDGGAVYIRGGQFVLQGGCIYATTAGSNPGGGVDIKVTGDVVLDSGGITGGGNILSQTYDVGRAGDVVIAANNMNIKNYAAIDTSTYGAGMGGNIFISAADTVSITDSSYIRSVAKDIGNAGDITLNVGKLNMSGSAFFNTSSYSSGRGGNIFISATDTVSMTDSSGVGSIATDIGNAGDITLKAGKLDMSGSAGITTSTFGAGNAGNINIKATASVNISDSNSSISADTYSDGNGGIIYISTPALSISNGAMITALAQGAGNAGNTTLDVGRLDISGGSGCDTSTSGSGNAGNINIKATDSVNISDSNSSIHADTYSDGNGGIIYISTPALNIVNGAIITANAQGAGNAGNITLDVGRLDISGGSGCDTSTYLGNGNAGNINITATDSVGISGNFIAINASTSTTGKGGNVYIFSPKLTIAGGAAIDSSTFGGGGDAGNITLNVGRLDISVGIIDSSNYGKGNAGNINITATDSVGIMGFGSVISSNAFVGSSGRGGSVSISSPKIMISDKGSITSLTDGDGNAGSITLDVGSLDVSNAWVNTSANIGKGNGGNINITATDSVSVSGSGGIASYVGVVSTGKGGDISISSPKITIAGQAQITTSTLGDGDAGNIKLDVGRLDISGDLSMLSTNTNFGKGNAGNINITATDSVSVSGSNGISAATSCSGKGGDISISSPTLTLADGAMIYTSSFLDGKAGNISLDVGSLDISGVYSMVNSSTYGNGNAGNINITATGSVGISGFGARIATYTRGSGDAGMIGINTDTLVLTGGAKIDSGTNSNGKGGQIDISAKDYITMNGSEISTSSSGSGNGGTILLQMANLQMDNNASISAKGSDIGRGGDITLNAAQTISLLNGSNITTETLKSDGGNIEIRAPQLVYLFGSGITTSVQGGLGNGGNITIDPQFVILNNSNIIANAYGGNGGNINIFSDYFFKSPDSTVQASSQLGISGTINITAPDIDLSGSLAVLPSNYLDATSLMRDRCAALSDEKASSLVVVGRGGMPIEPDDFLPSP